MAELYIWCLNHDIILFHISYLASQHLIYRCCLKRLLHPSSLLYHQSSVSFHCLIPGLFPYQIILTTMSTVTKSIFPKHHFYHVTPCPETESFKLLRKSVLNMSANFQGLHNLTLRYLSNFVDNYMPTCKAHSIQVGLFSVHS